MTEQPGASVRQFAFGPFRFFPEQKLLVEAGTGIGLGSRAQAILLALLESHGQVVGKAELIRRAWPDTFVEEANLRVHIKTLRKALADGQSGRRYIVNVPGRGYCFVAPVERAAAADPAAATLAAPTTARAAAMAEQAGLPPAPARIIGRGETIPMLLALLQEHRFVSVVGPGGIGKSTVALAVAHGLLDRFGDGIRFVDLAALSDPRRVPAAIAAALDTSLAGETPLPGLVAAARARPILLLLDSCEHVIDAVSSLVEPLFAQAGGALHILATSREPLRVLGERVHRLAPLGAPPPGEDASGAAALAYPAVQLFVERAALSLDGFQLTDAAAPLVADLCRRLDGIALAIEIAAGRVEALGLEGLASRVDDRLSLQLRGRRTALPRHQTLQALLDWSHALLPDFEQHVFRQLAILAGTFTMDEALAILAEPGRTDAAIVEAIAGLVEKSLIAVEEYGLRIRYRLADTVRAYGLAKLADAGALAPLRRRHAEVFRQALQQAARAWEVQPAEAWTRAHRHLIDNARAALEWAYSPDGDAGIGLALTLGGVPLWFQLQLIGEAHQQVVLALASASPEREPEACMRLQAVLAWSLMQIRGQVEETRAAWQRTLELAEALGDTDYQLRALWGLWSHRLNRSRFREALELAHRFAAVAAERGAANDGHVGDRMIGYILHLLGHQAEARDCLERMVRGYVVPAEGAQFIRFVFEQRATGRCFLARILWLQGAFGAALEQVDDIVATAIAAGDRLTLCQVLVQAACPIALFAEDLPRARRFVALLAEASAQDGIAFWRVWAECFGSILTIRDGDPATGLAQLDEGLGRLRQIDYGVYYVVFLAEQARALAATGRFEQAEACLREALDRSTRNEEGWFMAELWCLAAELAEARGGPEAAPRIEAALHTAQELARAQAAPFWEIKSGLGLARLRQRQGRAAEAEALLAPLLRRFTDQAEQPLLRRLAALREAGTRG